jgi:hypothetical protein
VPDRLDKIDERDPELRVAEVGILAGEVRHGVV